MQFRAMNPESQALDLVTAGQGDRTLALRNPVPPCPDSLPEQRRIFGDLGAAKLLFPGLVFVCQDWGCPARRRLRFPSWRPDLSRSTLYPRVTLNRRQPC